jgi:hypothetical protein
LTGVGAGGRTTEIENDPLVGGGFGRVAFVIEHRQQTMSVEQAGFDEQTGFQRLDGALILTETG